MKFKRYLSESFFKSFKDTQFGSYVEIFKNPDRQEMREVLDSQFQVVRFIADSKTKSLYVFTSDVVMHPQVWPVISGKKDIYKNPSLIPGTAEYDGSTFLVLADDIERLNNNQIKGILKKDWKWLEKYKLDVYSVFIPELKEYYDEVIIHKARWQKRKRRSKW